MAPCVAVSQLNATPVITYYHPFMCVIHFAAVSVWNQVNKNVFFFLGRFCSRAEVLNFVKWKPAWSKQRKFATQNKIMSFTHVYSCNLNIKLCCVSLVWVERDITASSSSIALAILNLYYPILLIDLYSYLSYHGLGLNLQISALYS